jgi:RHS repeat-associated protein
VVSETNPSAGDESRYTGAAWNPETNLQYNRQRYYDPETGRWLSQDPLGFAAGDGNLYRYLGNNVTNATDPSGLVLVAEEGSTYLQQNLKEAKVTFVTAKLPSGRILIDLLDPHTADALVSDGPLHPVLLAAFRQGPWSVPTGAQPIPPPWWPSVA